ncbi:GTPase HflX [Pseudogemmobacter sp. W21_MBD1_M6]|uniref:GTPase HflX n=1 Tax=Pseudogemmobacter sp. W21_MBD1_M6 TaxID=3240271 RepID=UPI003F94EB4D
MEHEDRGAMRAWVLHPDLKLDRQRRAPDNALDEAVALAAALPDMEVVGADIVRLPKPVAGMLFGKGKIAELKQKFHDAEVGLVLVDGPVTPVQQRNLEKEWKVKVLDRTGLILEIFSDRARTNEGVLQVELAALSYQRTRLVRAWTHLERQRGGLGFVGGPGETQIESDRRAIDDAILRIKAHLEKVVKTRELHRAARKRDDFPVVALVGYTNAGKSTLFNRLTGADVFVKDMLFATLDPTMRGLTLPEGREVILSDTVGFISDLPTQLVAAFRATLEEVLDADLILHVRDISHPQSREQAADVEEILTQLGVAEDAPIIEVWNKMDALPDDARASFEVQAQRSDHIIPISALTGDGIDDLMAAIGGTLEPAKIVETIVVPYSNGRARAWLFAEGLVEEEEAAEDGFHLKVRWTERQQQQYLAL